MNKEPTRVQMIIDELIINSRPLYSKGTNERFFDTNIGGGNKRGISERELVAGLYHMQTQGCTIQQFARAAQLSVTRLEYIIEKTQMDASFLAFRDRIFYNDQARDMYRSEYVSFDKFGQKMREVDTFLKVDNKDVPNQEIGKKRLLAAYYLCTFDHKTVGNVADALNIKEETLTDLWEQFMSEEWFENFRANSNSWAIGEGSKEANYLRNRCFQVLEKANVNKVSETERIKVLQYHPDNLRGLKRELYTPEEYHQYCRVAVLSNGLALQHVPQELMFKDREMCLQGVREFGAALKYLPFSLRDREICKTAVSNFGYALWDVPPRVKDRDICWIAMMNDGRAIEFAPKSMISEELYTRAEADFKELFKPIRFAPDDAKLNRMRRAELSKKITGIAPRNLPKKAPIIKPSDIVLADVTHFLPEATPGQRRNAEQNFEKYAPKIAEFANRAIAFRMGTLSAFEFMKAPPFNVNQTEMTENWAFREAVFASEYWVQKYPEKMRLFLMPKPYFISKTPLNVPLLTLKQCREANPYGESFRMSAADKVAFRILETYHAELAIAYRVGLITAKEYFNTPPAPYRNEFQNERQIKTAADQSTAYYANLFKEQIDNRRSLSSKTENNSEKTNIQTALKR